MSDDTRDLVIELKSDVRHLVEKLDAHVTSTETRHERIDKKFACFEKKQDEMNDLIQQVKGAGILAGYVKPLVASAVTFAAGGGIVKWFGLLR